MTARFAKNMDHIVSLLVQVRPERIDAVTAILAGRESVEIHGSDPQGKIIVTVESGSDRRLLDTISWIEATPGVIAAPLVYHQVEETEA
ncbi:MAG: nitrate reductase NapD [Alphaproteobacteria bacterium]|jgi:nitrate reductase NapD